MNFEFVKLSNDPCGAIFSKPLKTMQMKPFEKMVPIDVCPVVFGID